MMVQLTVVVLPITDDSKRHHQDLIYDIKIGGQTSSNPICLSTLWLWRPNQLYGLCWFL